MEMNKEEALRAKANAEKRFAERDFSGAKNYAIKAQMLFPELEGVSQMVATFGVYSAYEVKVNGEIDFYSILGLDPSVEKSKLKKQYKKMAVLLHPDKNKTAGADGAFRLVSEAWSLLSDNAKRSSYDLRRNMHLSSGVVQTNLSLVHPAGDYNNCSKSSASHNRLDTFWTVCTSCHVQYEYLRKYVNKRLSCKNCRGVFIAVETGAAPVSGSFPYCPWSYVPDNGYGSHGYNGVTYVPTTAMHRTENGGSKCHNGHRTEYGPNVSFQWNLFTGASAGVVDHNGYAATSGTVVHQGNASVSRTKTNGKNLKAAAVDFGSNGFLRYNEVPASRPGRPPKKPKIEMGGSCHSGNEETASKIASEISMVDGNGDIKQNAKFSTPVEVSTKRISSAPPFDARKFLIDRARTEICKKLEEMRLASTAAAAVAVVDKNGIVNADVGKNKTSEAHKIRACLGGPSHQLELKKSGPTVITVPDSDFHDFDKDRAEECFKPKQIWALYDEEDGMPRLYCLIRQVISVKPFRIHISYLNSKTDSEFGSVNWVDSGFTKSCGHFRAFHSEVVDQVNIFSHLLSREKAGRGGCVRIYPRSGDIWAVYQNWSPNWDRTTPEEVRHRYEMVEVLVDYSEELGVCVSPLVKLDGFKTVYQTNKSKEAIRWIPRREMLRFSHQVPSWSLKGETGNLPGGCWDLDPAATPDELLQGAAEARAEEKPREAENFLNSPDGFCQSAVEAESKELSSQVSNSAATRDQHHHTVTEERAKENPIQVDNFCMGRSSLSLF